MNDLKLESKPVTTDNPNASAELRSKDLLAAGLAYLRDTVSKDTNENSTMEELALDSLDMVELAMACEEAVGVCIDDEHISLTSKHTLKQWADEAAKYVTPDEAANDRGER